MTTTRRSFLGGVAALASSSLVAGALEQRPTNPIASSKASPRFAIVLHGLFALDFRDRNHLTIYAADVAGVANHHHAYCTGHPATGLLMDAQPGSPQWGSSQTKPTQDVIKGVMPLIHPFSGNIHGEKYHLQLPYPSNYRSLRPSSYRVPGADGSISIAVALEYDAAPNGDVFTGAKASSDGRLHVYAEPICSGILPDTGKGAFQKLLDMLSNPSGVSAPAPATVPPSSPPSTYYDANDLLSLPEVTRLVCAPQNALRSKMASRSYPFGFELPTCVPVAVGD